MIKLPLVGPAYKMQSQSISSQNCINWYPQTIEYPNGSRVAALMPTPGLKKIFQGITAAARCLHVLSNGALLAVIGNKLYHSKANKFELTEVGLISALGTVRVDDNGRVALIVNGTYTYSLDLKKLTLERLSGSAIPRSSHVVFMDGRFVFNKANTGQFHWSDLYSTNVNALSYATAESMPDNITAIIKANPSELWLFGPQSVERYYGTGSANAPYSRLSGGAMSFGCLAPDSIVALATGVVWLGVSDFGGNQIVMSGGGIPERISTHALEEEIASFSKTTDATAYAYQMEGHVFYVISFPSANVTFCYDVSTGLWHQRSFANPQGLHERHRSQHHAFYNNIHIVGDYRNGKLYQLDNNIFTDDGELILRERTAQAVITDNKLTRFNQLQIICETGFYGSTPKPAPQPPSISCTGALNITDWIDIDGDYGLEIEGAKISDSAPLLEIIDLLRANNFEVTIDEEPLVATPFAALNVDNDTEYRVSMNGAPLLNPATGISSFKNLGKYPNFVIDGTTSFDLYMAVVTASGSKATAIGYQDSQVPPDHPLYTDKPILVVVTEEATGFSFEFEALTGSTDITQNAEYEQRLISNSDFPDEPLNGTIRKSGNIVSCSVAGPEPKTMLEIRSKPTYLSDYWMNIGCTAKNTLNNTVTFTATDNLGNTFTEVRTDVPPYIFDFEIPRHSLVSENPLTGTSFNFTLTAQDLNGVSQTVTGSYDLSEGL